MSPTPRCVVADTCARVGCCHRLEFTHTQGVFQVGRAVCDIVLDILALSGEYETAAGLLHNVRGSAACAECRTSVAVGLRALFRWPQRLVWSLMPTCGLTSSCAMPTR